jgi:hypothetical protein
MRKFEDGPISEVSNGPSGLCDFDTAQDAGLPLGAVVEAGLTQRTCPVCHVEFFSSLGL